jgi:hypothetical protein
MMAIEKSTLIVRHELSGIPIRIVRDERLNYEALLFFQCSPAKLPLTV